MVLLDTDHLTVLKFPGSSRAAQLTRRLAAMTDEVIGTTVVNIEEQMRGWMASIAKERQPRRQVTPYRELASLFEFFAEFEIALFDDDAAGRFEELRSSKRRVATSDLKIAAVALSHDALLLTASKRDFEQVPDMRFENWMD